MTVRYSPSYMFTVTDKNDEKVVMLKEMLKATDAAKRVVFKGRLGKNNPAAIKYKNSNSYNPYSYIKHEDASRFDVYVYEKSPYYE
jgi:hypothetical protein